MSGGARLGIWGALGWGREAGVGYGALVWVRGRGYGTLGWGHKVWGIGDTGPGLRNWG